MVFGCLPDGYTEQQKAANERADLEWERGLALEDEFKVQALLRGGLDFEKADCVRRVLLDNRAGARADLRVIRAERCRGASDWREKLGKRAVARSIETERQLKTVLSPEEFRAFKESADSAHLEAVLILRRERPVRAVEQRIP